LGVGLVDSGVDVGFGVDSGAEVVVLGCAAGVPPGFPSSSSLFVAPGVLGDEGADVAGDLDDSDSVATGSGTDSSTDGLVSSPSVRSARSSGLSCRSA
jgi:hypothetical protein